MIDIIFLAIIFVISISLHEYAHAWSSYKLGDPTPKIQGRLTPNPLVHIDPIGFLMIFIIHFGRGRPVIVNPSYYKNTLRDELLVALAGPATNIVLAVLGTLIMLVYAKIVGIGSALAQDDLIIQFWFLFSWINVALAVFNMIPIYPLDGYRIVKYLAPELGALMEQYRQYITIALLLFIFLPGTSGILSNFIVSISQFILGIIHFLLSAIII